MEAPYLPENVLATIKAHIAQLRDCVNAHREALKWSEDEAERDDILLRLKWDEEDIEELEKQAREIESRLHPESCLF